MSAQVRLASALALAHVLGALVACDSTDASSSGGSSSSGATSGGAAPDGGAGGIGGAGGEPPSYGGTAADPCGNLCSKFDELGCDLSACEQLCPGWIEHAGDCAPLMAAEIDCIADATMACGDDVCQEEFAALDECAGGVDCFAQSCKGTSEGGTSTCECSTGCSNGRVQIVCLTDAAEVTTCDCFVGGEKVGSCDEPLDFCDIDHGCCADHF